MWSNIQIIIQAKKNIIHVDTKIYLNNQSLHTEKYVKKSIESDNSSHLTINRFSTSMIYFASTRRPNCTTVAVLVLIALVCIAQCKN